MVGGADTLETDLSIAAVRVGIGEVGEEAENALAFREEPLTQRRGHRAGVASSAARRRRVLRQRVYSRVNSRPIVFSEGLLFA